MTQLYKTSSQREATEDAELAAAERALSMTTDSPEITPVDTPTDTKAEPTEPQVDWEKRYKDHQSYADKQMATLQSELKALKGEKPSTEDEVNALREQVASLQGKEALRETESIVQQAQNQVGEAHPDFVGIINSHEFAEWVKTQPQVYQDAVYAERPDAVMAINALTLFKTGTGYNQRQDKAKQAKMQQDAAMSVNGGHREAPQSSTEKVWTYAEIDSLSPTQYDKLEATIDKAISEGRVR
jgi:chromosome segregation ATPase